MLVPSKSRLARSAVHHRPVKPWNRADLLPRVTDQLTATDKPHDLPAELTEPYQRPRSSNHKLMADLLQRIAEKADADAFNELFQSFAPRVKSYMMRQGADPTTAEELAQETLLMVWRKAALYSGDKGSASTWIFTIARNLRIDRLRREVPWQELPEGHNEISSDDPTPDQIVSDRERQERTQAALATLPEDQKAVVSLSYLEGLSHSEIADRLNLPLGTVKSRMRLAYLKIRQAVEDLK
jgi:RNA polymerase sigma-70 factor, ECF subfamily